MEFSDNRLETAARELEASGRYRVYRRIDLISNLVPNDGTQVKTGMFLDIESTGLDVMSSDPIEIALMPFEYRSDGGIVAVHPPLHQYNEPSTPISAEITQITGITNEMVNGKSIDVSVLEKFIDDAVIIIAHNANFDRPIAERISSAFTRKAWACTMQDVDWISYGFQGKRLSDLLGAYRFFFDAHRASHDCEAGISLLTQKLPNSDIRVLSEVLTNARSQYWRVFAVDAPFNHKDTLRLRGYKWNSSNNFGPRAWWIDLKDENLKTEIQFLEENVFGYSIDLPRRKITAFNRFSSRIN